MKIVSEIKLAYLARIEQKRDKLRSSLVDVQIELELNPLNARANSEYKSIAYEIMQLEKHIAQVRAE
jgi:hypothetical protein